MKFLQIKDRGHLWVIPAHRIASHKANYYGQLAQDRGEDSHQIFIEEFDACMESGREIEDWYANNMNWEDVAPWAFRAEVPLALEKPDRRLEELDVVEREDYIEELCRKA
ncbi:hypothetical protein PP940_gp036 [Rhizobium phage RL2RES]|uniref:Uncharacterized protein n=1 Tax=Rhizobium phage RL2RES TaxID=103371 RepID=A0A6B9J653_9CAUD|nr:hypothetical protein PP940_gp036 [Rhizobium phage RL2RES]QGZ14245.1 hypothetical protein RL2RES_036 [Rhizobium phage RL2RES]